MTLCLDMYFLLPTQKKLHRVRSGGTGGGAGFTCAANRSSWFGFSARANQAFHPSGGGELVPVLSERDKQDA